jgi:hypothetical protein
VLLRSKRHWVLEPFDLSSPVAIHVMLSRWLTIDMVVSMVLEQNVVVLIVLFISLGLSFMISVILALFLQGVCC